MSNKYQNGVKKIKCDLSRFTDISFIKNLMKHFNEGEKHGYSLVKKLPWCCFLALKWKLGGSGSNSVDMTERDFNKIINAVFNLQSHAADFKVDLPIDLQLRRFLIPQLLFQNTHAFYFESVTRQYQWFCKSENGYFNQVFEEETKLDLDDYYGITLCLILLSSTHRSNESFSMSYGDLLVKLSPYYSIDAISRYVKLVSLDVEKMKDYCGGYINSSNPPWEYFEDTPLLFKPIVTHNNYLHFISKTIFISGVSNLVPFLLKKKKKEEFKTEFGPLLEEYLGDVINDSGYKYITENKVKDIYRENSIKGKVVDYVIFEDTATVFIDSKAIEPEVVVKTSDSPEQLKSRLDGSFIKGIEQSQACACMLEKCNKYTPSHKDVALIVTHKDHFISTGRKVCDLISTSLVNTIENEYEKIRIPLTRTYYITIDDFETLIELCKVKQISISDVVNVFEEKDSDNLTMRFNFYQHMREVSDIQYSAHPLIEQLKETLFDQAVDILKHNKKSWSGEIDRYLFYTSQLTKKIHA
ncbi:TPA: hypothetical protein ACPJ09_004566 [Vibrio diabolicus]